MQRDNQNTCHSVPDTLYYGKISLIMLVHRKRIVRALLTGLTTDELHARWRPQRRTPHNRQGASQTQAGGLV